MENVDQDDVLIDGLSSVRETPNQIVL